jgi:hypothetical protein
MDLVADNLFVALFVSWTIFLNPIFLPNYCRVGPVRTLVPIILHPHSGYNDFFSSQLHLSVFTET